MKCTDGCRRIAAMSGKCSDLVSTTGPNGTVIDGRVPKDMNVGGGDYIDISWCLDCGTLGGKWPLKQTEIEQSTELTDDSEEDW
jgi:hypothetical protein